MPRIDPNTVLWKEVEGAVIVLLISSGNFIELNKVGSAIWKLLAEGKSRDAIIDEMSTMYDVSQEKLSSDVDAFITRMTTQGMLAA